MSLRNKLKFYWKFGKFISLGKMQGLLVRLHLCKTLTGKLTFNTEEEQFFFRKGYDELLKRLF